MRGRVRDERGAFMALFALLLVGLVAMVAVAVDLSSLRQDRRGDRKATDLAAAAGVSQLDVNGGGSPKAACLAAWGYLEQNLGWSTALPDPCGSFPTVCEADETTVGTTTVGDSTVTIEIPVADTSTMMKAELPSGDIAQPVTTSDGGPCQRVGVEVRKTRRMSFAGVVGWNSATTDVHSVARLVPGAGGPLPTLVTLEQTHCPGVDANSASVTLQSSGNYPGIAYADSDGTDKGCKAANPVLNAQGSNGNITAQPGADGTPSVIATFDGKSDGTASQGTISPTPTVNAARITRMPVDATYHCGNLPKGCQSGTPDPVQQLVSAYDSTLPPGFTTITNCAPAVPLVVNANTFVNCPDSGGKAGFAIKNTAVTITGGPVVFAGSIDVQTGGTFTVNTLWPTTGADAIVYLRNNGSLLFEAGSVSTFTHTFVYSANHAATSGNSPISVAAGSTVSWSPATATNDAFQKLMFWSEGTGQSKFAGQPALNMDGVFFAPNSAFTLQGGSNIDASNVQFWVNSLILGGNTSSLLLRPDPANSLTVNGGVNLVR